MKFSAPLTECILLRRYKRFLADIRTKSGEILTVHCPNPGAMMGLDQPGSRCWISDSGNPKRKLRYTLELVEAQAPTGKVLVGVNTNLPNKLAEEAIGSGMVPSLAGYETLRREVPYGTNSRIDILLQSPGRRDCFVEVKNVHLVREAGLHEFPDCRTARGAKHLDALARQVERANRAVMLYVIQREDGDRFSLAQDIDPAYAAAFRAALSAGVEAHAIRCQISVSGISADTAVEIVI